MCGAASWGGAVKREDDQPNNVARRHAETPLVVWLLGAHETQGAVVSVFGVKVEGHR